MPFVSTILCVDDDEDDLHFIREVIRTQNGAIHIHEAKNGAEALRFLDDSLTKDQLPCLLIMDMNMPRMDGKQTLRRIRENSGLNAIPIVVFTTSANPADRAYFEEKGVHFLTKPFDYSVFTRQIIGLLALCADANG